MVVRVDSAGQVRTAGGAVGAEEPRRREDGVGRVVGARRVHPARGHGHVVGGERRGLELHRALGPRRVGPAVHAGQVRLAVVRLHRADGGQHRPGQPDAGRGGLLVEREHGRGDAGRRRADRRPASAEERDGRGDHRRAHRGHEKRSRHAPRRRRPSPAAGPEPGRSGAGPDGGAGRRSEQGHGPERSARQEASPHGQRTGRCGRPPFRRRPGSRSHRSTGGHGCSHHARDDDRPPPSNWRCASPSFNPRLIL